MRIGFILSPHDGHWRLSRGSKSINDFERRNDAMRAADPLTTVMARHANTPDKMRQADGSDQELASYTWEGLPVFVLNKSLLSRSHPSEMSKAKRASRKRRKVHWQYKPNAEGKVDKAADPVRNTTGGASGPLETDSRNGRKLARETTPAAAEQPTLSP